MILFVDELLDEWRGVLERQQRRRDARRGSMADDLRSSGASTLLEQTAPSMPRSKSSLALSQAAEPESVRIQLQTLLLMPYLFRFFVCSHHLLVQLHFMFDCNRAMCR
jgi:hypothetical protein